MSLEAALKKLQINRVDLLSAQVSTARTSRDHLRSHLKGQLTAKGLPATGQYYAFGSFARKTKVRPLDDLDDLVRLDGPGTFVSTVNQGPGTKLYVKETSPWYVHRHPDSGGWFSQATLSSTKVLNAFKAALTGVPAYKSASIRRSGVAVVLELSYPWTYDIVPAFPVQGGSSGVSYFLIPDGQGHWMTTDPRIDDSNVTEANKRQNGLFLPIVRLLKFWNQHGNGSTSGRFESYSLEALAYYVFKNGAVVGSISEGLAYFFANVPVHSSWPDPKKLGPRLDAGLTPQQRTALSTRTSNAAAHAAAGLAAVKKGDVDLAKAHYSVILGVTL